jgi:SAM-dependent methyltransferase
MICAMKLATRTSAPTSGMNGSTREAWSAFWQEPGQSRCVAGASGIWQSLTQHWREFADTLPASARALDLGCGAGAVARLLLGARPDLQATGIDFAHIPLTLDTRLELLAETAMESLPFADASFCAVVSQFGFEYGDTRSASRELARVLKPRGRLSLLVHHADSAIVRTNRIRLGALGGFLSPALRAAFCAANVETFHAQLGSLLAQYASDALLAELARSLPSRLGRAPRERVAIWNAVEEALAPEHRLALSLDNCCVAAARLEEWLLPLRNVCDIGEVGVVREPDGQPVAWRIEGSRRC